MNAILFDFIDAQINSKIENIQGHPLCKSFGSVPKISMHETYKWKCQKSNDCAGRRPTAYYPYPYASTCATPSPPNINLDIKNKGSSRQQCNNHSDAVLNI